MWDPRDSFLASAAATDASAMSSKPLVLRREINSVFIIPVESVIPDGVLRNSPIAEAAALRPSASRFVPMWAFIVNESALRIVPAVAPPLPADDKI